jgi:holo-[acyl-carrier protein] synthase
LTGSRSPLPTRNASLADCASRQQAGITPTLASSSQNNLHLIAPPGAYLNGIGIDLANIDEVRQALAEFGEAYLHRLFTDHEVEYCSRWPDPAPHLAARFAAKEATLKVLGLHDGRAPWTSIEVRTASPSHCEITLSGIAALAATERGITRFRVSLCQAGDNAGAVVVAEPLQS